tara:strand:+ start:18 stop:542 length:525 start_codon:yes stop_codon:yes gene_type:complete
MKKDDVISYRENVYDPLNQGIDEQNRILRSRSTWRYSKAFALGLVALGIFLVLAAYAYYFFNRHYFQRLDKIDDDIISSSSGVSIATHRFIKKTNVGPGGSYSVHTRFQYSKTSDLLKGVEQEITCYISKGSVSLELGRQGGSIPFNPQGKLLIGLNDSQINEMKSKYCRYNGY